MKNTRKNSGITLIALIITVIVIVILAGVTISTLTRGNILGNAENVVARYNNKVAEEQEKLDEVERIINGEDEGPTILKPTITLPNTTEFLHDGNQKDISVSVTGPENYAVYYSTTELISSNYTSGSTEKISVGPNWGKYKIYYYVKSTDNNYIDKKGNFEVSIIPNVDANGLATENTTITTSAANVKITIPAGFAPVILNGSNTTSSTTSQNGRVKAIIPANEWINITAEQINKGIVVVDHAITSTAGVPDYNEYVWVPIPNSSDFTRVAWTWIYTDDNNKQVQETQILANAQATDEFWEDTTTEEYQNMLSSVNTNKGFYISRYEASQGTNNVAQSKRGQTAWVNIPQNDSSKTIDAIRASIANNTANTHLIYGIEWDSVLKWLEANVTINGTGLSAVDSRNWGNHNNSISPANNSPWVSSTLQNTGASEYWKANNIYDLAGNARELTQERYSTGNSGSARGGTYDFTGDGYIGPAASRDRVGILNPWIDRGFRFSFYL